MKGWIKLLSTVACGVLLGGNAVVARAEELAPACKAAYLCDFETGTAVYTKNENERRPIASMCKIMTLLLTFEAAERDELSLDEEVVVSERAQGMGGSQVYLEAGSSYRVEDLMRTVAVCSANDSCVALAEKVAGSEEGFVEKMNARAKELKANNTLFANCTGLPKEPQYSCAKDVATMLRALLHHEKYFELCREWTEEFAHPNGRTTLITNTNKLIRAYNGCDGGKTGFTNEAGFCLAATAKRGDTRLISVVMGAESSKERNRQVCSLFDYAFANFSSEIVVDRGEIEQKAPVKNSKEKEIGVEIQSPLSVFRKKGEENDVQCEFLWKEDLWAPIEKGSTVGEAILTKDGIEIARTPLVASETAHTFTWWDAYREAAQNWN